MIRADLSALTSLAAFGLSLYSTITTFRFNKRQEQLIRSQEALNALQSERERSSLLAARKADLGATFLSLGSNSHRLRIFNRGPHAARDVRVEFPEENDLVSERDVEEKFPMETLDRQQSVDVLASVHLSSPSKLVVRILWIDGDGEHREKVVHATR